MSDSHQPVWVKSHCAWDGGLYEADMAVNPETGERDWFDPWCSKECFEKHLERF